MVGWHSISYFCRGGCLWDHILGLSLGWIWFLFWNMLLALRNSITFPRYILADWIWFLFWNNCAMFTFETFMFSPWITICINPARSLKAKHWIIFIHLLCWVYLEDIMGWLHGVIYWGMGSQHIFSYVSLIFFKVIGQKLLHFIFYARIYAVIDIFIPICEISLWNTNSTINMLLSEGF